MARTTKKSQKDANPLDATADGKLLVYVARENQGNSQAEGTLLLKDADGKLEDYLNRNGMLFQPFADGKSQREVEKQRLRKVYHRNINALLGIYRELICTYHLFLQEFALRVDYETGTPFKELFPTINESGEPQVALDITSSSTDMFFDRLTQELDILSVTDEKKFRNVWAPQIATGRKIEFALYSVDFGLKLLQAQDQKSYDLLKFVYIDGERKPTIKAILDHFKIMSPGTYYSLLEKATDRLAVLTFSFTDKKSELNSILSYLEHLHNEGILFEDEDQI